MAKLILDTSHAPVWYVRYPEEFAIEDYRSYLERFTASCEEGKRYSLLIDLTRFNPLFGNSKAREEAAQAVKENIEFYERVLVAEARVINNPVVRGIITVFDWLARLPWPTKNFSNPVVAEGWLADRLREAGLEAPAESAWPQAAVVQAVGD